MRRTFLTIVVCLVIGAVVTIAFTTYLHFYSMPNRLGEVVIRNGQFPPYRREQTAYWTHEHRLDDSIPTTADLDDVLRKLPFDSADGTRITVYALRGFGNHWLIAYYQLGEWRLDHPHYPFSTKQLVERINRQIGYPFAVAACDRSVRDPRDAQMMAALADSMNDHPPWDQFTDQHMRYEPLFRPDTLLWTGFLANTAVYGTLVFILLHSVLLVCRNTRRLHGRCPRCAYDLRGEFANGCPECGWNRDQIPLAE